MGQDRPGSHAPGQQPPERARRAAVSPGVLGQRARIDLELDQPAHRLERVAKQELRPVERAEQVAQDRECRPLGPAKQQGRPARLINPPLDGGDFQIGVDLLVDDDELPCLVPGRGRIPPAIDNPQTRPFSNARPARLAWFHEAVTSRSREYWPHSLIAARRYCTHVCRDFPCDAGAMRRFGAGKTGAKFCGSVTNESVSYMGRILSFWRIESCETRTEPGV